MEAWKRLLILLALAIFTQLTWAQVQLSPAATGEIDGLSGDQKVLIENRLRNVLSSHGMLSQMGYSRFILAARLTVVEKEVLATAPTQIVLRLSANIAVGDGVSGICFGSYEMFLKGVGRTEKAAVTAAVRNIAANSEQMNILLENATKRIVDYYDQESPNILTRATTLASQGKYDEAIYEIMLIPKECKNYAKAQSQVSKVYKQYVNHNAISLLNQAKAMWAGEPTPENAANAMALLADVDPSADNYAEVKAFINQVESKVSQTNSQREANALAQEKARLNAIENIAVAFAKNQPKKIWRVFW